jgi:hypothetical protein
MTPSIRYDDNQSIMLQEKSGRGLSSKHAKHMIVRSSFVSDSQQCNHIIVTYFPSDEMIEDCITKLLASIKFDDFCNIIVNCSTDDYEPVNVDELMATYFGHVHKKLQSQL